MTDHDRDSGQVEAGQRRSAALVLAGIIIIAVTIFIAQNTEEIGFDFLTFTFTMPLWLMMVLMLVAGALIGQVVMYVRRRRKQADRPT